MHRASRGPNCCYAAIRARTLMRRQLPNKHREPPVNTIRTSERKSKESAHFGCQDAAHTRPRGALRPLIRHRHSSWTMVFNFIAHHGIIKLFTSLNQPFNHVKIIVQRTT